MGRQGETTKATEATGIFPPKAAYATIGIGIIWIAGFYFLGRFAGFKVPLACLLTGMTLGLACRANGGGGKAAILPCAIITLLATAGALYLGPVGFQARAVEVTAQKYGLQGEVMESLVADFVEQELPLPSPLLALGVILGSVLTAIALVRASHESLRTYSRDRSPERVPPQASGEGSGAPTPTRSRRGRRRR